MRSFLKYSVLKNAGLEALFLVFLWSNSASGCESRTSSLFGSGQSDLKTLSILFPSFVASDEKSPDDQKDLQEQLRLLLDELKQLGKEGEEKLRKDIVPYLRREIEKLRNRLKEFRPDKEEPSQPQRTQAEPPCPFV